MSRTTVPIETAAVVETPDHASSSAVRLIFSLLKLADRKPKHDLDVAIVGMSCRTAGGNDTPEKLWQFLLEKRHASGEVPRKRWEPWLRRDTRNARTIANTTSKGYFIENLECFDAAFFGISPKEAESMDPHQRLALELSWEALENAGIDPKQLSGSDTAVFMGVDSDDYARLILEDLPNIESWSGISTAYHGIPNRVSYFLNLMGPSVAVDAACASSLVAIHQGRQAILSGESSVALCGGVNVLCAPGLTYMLDRAGALASDGLCISFDDNAHGYARGEGGGIVVLKRLSSAIANSDNILAVLKGTATAQDGRTDGIMAPNARAQEMVAKQALSRAGDLDPLTVGYVEAHATSTALGDPTEIRAISQVYGFGRASDKPCAVGSIKPNVGHLEAAAGVVGFIKAVMAVNKGELAPQTLLNKLNTRIDWETSGLQVVRERVRWPQIPGLRRAAVCSYGYGGSVAHAILEQTPAPSVRISDECINVEEKEVVTLVLSSFQKTRLPNQALQLADWLVGSGRQVNLKAIASTLSQRRAAQDYRTAFVVESHDEAIDALQKFATGHPDKWTVSSRVLGLKTRKDAVWVFSGHGAQWANMGKQLLKNATFYGMVAKLDELVEREAGFSALLALQTGYADGASTTQVLTYLMQIGLAEVLRKRGVVPQAVVGHSVGEIAASVVAGCLTPDEGALLVSRRARLYAQVEGQGGMALVYIPFAQAENELAMRKDIAAAIDSSPGSCVVSGEIESLEQYLSELARKDIKTLRISTNVAFHSPILDELGTPLRLALEGAIMPRAARIPIYSTSQSNPRSEVLRGVDYWIQNMIGRVRFNGTITALAEDGYRIFVEISSHPIVINSINETLAAHGIEESITVGVMKRDTPAEKSLLHAIARLHTAGVSVNFEVQLGTTNWATSVPGTPWVQKPYWKEIEAAPLGASGQHDVDKHTLLGPCVDVAGSDTRVFTTVLDETTKPYPLKHSLDGTEIIPAAVYCNTFHHATSATVLRDVRLHVPTAITADQREVQVIAQGNSVRLSSRLMVSHDIRGNIRQPQHPWTDHSFCQWSREDMMVYNDTYDIDAIIEGIGDILPDNFVRAFLREVGASGLAYPWAVTLHYGNDKEMLAKIKLGSGQDTPWDSCSWAPVLDAAISVGSSVFFKSPKMRIVSGIDQIHFVSQQVPQQDIYLYIREANDSKSLAVDTCVLSEQGALLAKLKSIRFSDIETASDRMGALVHQLAWVPPIFTECPRAVDSVLLICDDKLLSEAYARDIRAFAKMLLKISAVDEWDNGELSDLLGREATIVIYVPGRVRSWDGVPEAAHKFTWEAMCLLKRLSNLPTTPRLFIVTDRVYRASSMTALAQSPLYGFARIAAQEHPEAWGGLIDNEGSKFPALALKYVQEHDVVRMLDGLPRIARLRPFTTDRQHSQSTLLPKPHGTYIVTGGFGDLGIETLDFLFRRGAYRFVVLSRSGLPPRSDWANADGKVKFILNRIEQMEGEGASIHSIALDLSSPNADSRLSTALHNLGLPPVLGVVHAAGVNEDGLISHITSASLSRVFSPKVEGALTLHKLFPPATLDFFILFSSIGQLVGTSGQAAYGAANSFLDALATHRRSQGDNAIAIQWTAWRGMGLAADSQFLAAELNSKGITDITCNEGFQAWEHLDGCNTAHAVVTRTKILDTDEPIPISLVSDIARRRASVAQMSPSPAARSTICPTSATELKSWLSSRVRECIATFLHMDPADVDNRTALADLGVNSVMTVALNKELQTAVGVKVPSTLMWKEPTVERLVAWFREKIEE